MYFNFVIGKEWLQGKVGTTKKNSIELKNDLQEEIMINLPELFQDFPQIFFNILEVSDLKLQCFKNNQGLRTNVSNSITTGKYEK